VKSPEFRSARRKFAQEFCKPPNIYTCIDGQPHQLTEDEYADLEKWVKDSGLL
jgi:hypothetical protein